MTERRAVRGVIAYVFCADAGAIADWCVEVLGFTERGRWPDEDGVVRNVELTLGDSEVWLDGPVPDWAERFGGLTSWIGFLVDDIDETHSQLTSRGAEVDGPVEREFGIKQLTVTDPEGHEWGFVQRLR